MRELSIPDLAKVSGTGAPELFAALFVATIITSGFVASDIYPYSSYPTYYYDYIEYDVYYPSYPIYYAPVW